MLTAKKAKERALNVKMGFHAELHEIERHIEDLSSSGVFYFSKSGYIHPQIKRLLEWLGYTVKTGTQYNEPYYTIRWD